MDPLDYQLTAEEKKRRKKEKFAAKKFSDDEELSDSHDHNNLQPVIKSVDKNVIHGNPGGKHVNGFKADASASPPATKVNGQNATKPIVNGKKLDKKERSHETPEKVCIEDVRSKVTTMKAADFLSNKNNHNLLSNSDNTSKPRRVKTSKHNDQLISYSQAPVINGITTLTQSSGTIMSVGRPLYAVSTLNEPGSSGSKLLRKKPEKREIVETINEPEHMLEAVSVSKIHKKSEYKLNRDEMVRRCNHDVARMMGKRFLDDQVCTKSRFIKLFLKAAVQGDVEKFQQLFEAGFKHLRSVKTLFLHSNCQLKRLFMLGLLRIFVDQGTDSNLFMLLSACYQKDDDSVLVSCNQLARKHGYCHLIQYLASFFRPTELKTLLGIRNCYSGRTCFSIASSAGNLCQQRVLLECGSNPNTVDDLGYSPMHYVIRRAQPRKDMFHLLLHWGADISIHFAGCCCNNSSYLKFVEDNAVDKNFGKFVSRKLTAVQKLYQNRLKEIVELSSRTIVRTASNIHTCRAFTPNRKTNLIEVDFELDLSLLDSLKAKEDLLLYMVPMRYRKEDRSADAQKPQIDFVDLKETNDKSKAEVLHDIVEHAPRFFSHIPVNTEVIDFQQADLPKTVMTHYAFVFKRMLPLPRIQLRGKLKFSTKCDAKAYKLFSDVIFGVQAVVVSNTCIARREPEMPGVNGKKGRKNNRKAAQTAKNGAATKTTTNVEVQQVPSPTKTTVKPGKTAAKNVDKIEQQKRAKKGSKAE